LASRDRTAAAARPFPILTERSQVSNQINERRFSESEVIKQKLLPVKNRITLHRWRKAKKLGFYRIGNKIFYGESHIRELLARCERKAKGVPA
jgi:hypothetical protein